MENYKYKRREFLQIAGITIGGTTVLKGCSQLPVQWRFFTEAEAKVVMAITEQIVPTDQDAGAREANVINFIDKQLVGFFKKHQHAYRMGIQGIQQTCNIMYKQQFEMLEWDQQTAVLEALESGQAKGETWKEESSQVFFELIRDHTMQGFYGSPRHGGNKRFASFRMIGIDYPRVVGQNRYKKFPGKG